MAPNQDVDFGDILVVEGKNGDRFYIRAYDFKVKSRWSGINNVGYLTSKLDADGQVQNQEELDFYLGGNHTVKIGMAEQLCYSDGQGQLYNPKTCPDFFSEVRALTQSDGTLLAEMKGDLEFGYLKSGRGVLELPVGIHGSKGHYRTYRYLWDDRLGGKATLSKFYRGSVIENGNYGMLIFDVHNEYYDDLSRHPATHGRLRVYNTAPSADYARKLDSELSRNRA